MYQTGATRPIDGSHGDRRQRGDREQAQGTLAPVVGGTDSRPGPPIGLPSTAITPASQTEDEAAR
ncbi:hypothetical protein GCM10010094_75680 [Streptomyces flaveus]|uniref:Uncharacterized protein n=1 Tax=Streptomyces flaveus TaxID=66370 RepID=A0A917VQD1_9ACTN|nr:hypothetical protein GCM10010094_75680 [Streptomyces flaveus]